MRILITIRLAFIIIFVVITEVSGRAKCNCSPSNDVGTLSSYSYVYFAESADSVNITDEVFHDIAGRVVFPVNEYRLNPSDRLLRELDGQVLPMVNRDSLELVRMMIRGAASPEGPAAHNKVLGERRAQALVDFVSQRLTFPVDKSVFSLDVEIEDYRSLCLLMHRHGDPDGKLVQELCDKYLPTGQTAMLKREIQRMRGGQLWRHLLKEYFPDLRTARIVLVFRKVRLPEPAPAPVIIEAPVVEETPVAVEAPVVAEELVPEPEVIETPAVVDTLPVTVIQQPDSQTVSRREFLSLKTNLLFYGVYMPGYDRWCPLPNVAVEYYPKKGHFTFGASLDFPWWQDYEDHKYFQVRNYQLETRYYLKKSPDVSDARDYRAPAFKGFYAQAYANVGLFGICFDANRGWVGEGIGAGIGAGYVMPLSRNGHWRLEFALQLGFFTCKYDPYQYENPIDPTYRDHLYYYKWTLEPELFKTRQYRYNWIGPTRIGVTLTYDLLYRRIAKKGVSFINHEEL